MTAHTHSIPTAMQLVALSQALELGDDESANAIAEPFHHCLGGALSLIHSIYMLGNTLASGYIGGTLNLGAGVDDELRAVDDPAVPPHVRAAAIFGNSVASGEHQRAIEQLRSDVLSTPGDKRDDFVLGVELVGLEMLTQLLSADPVAVRANGGEL